MIGRSASSLTVVLQQNTVRTDQRNDGWRIANAEGLICIQDLCLNS